MSASPGRTMVVLLALLPLGCATSNFDSLTNVQSMCDVTFEAGKVVQVSGDFDGDRYHGNGLFSQYCPGKYWTTDWSAEFYKKYVKRLELENIIWQGPNFSRYHIEVEGLLFASPEGVPGIKFLKLGKAERVTR